MPASLLYTFLQISIHFFFFIKYFGSLTHSYITFLSAQGPRSKSWQSRLRSCLLNKVWQEAHLFINSTFPFCSITAQFSRWSGVIINQPGSVVVIIFEEGINWINQVRTPAKSRIGDSIENMNGLPVHRAKVEDKKLLHTAGLNIYFKTLLISALPCWSQSLYLTCKFSPMVQSFASR